MSRKRFTPEQIIGKLREAEVGLAQGQTAAQVCRTLGRWRREYNTVRPHSALGYRPAAPEAIQDAAQRSWLRYASPGSLA